MQHYITVPLTFPGRGWEWGEGYTQRTHGIQKCWFASRSNTSEFTPSSADGSGRVKGHYLLGWRNTKRGFDYNVYSMERLAWRRKLLFK